MNYFEYNAKRTTSEGGANPQAEVLTFTGDETIQVDEDHTVTVDDVRKYIREMHDKATRRSSNVVSIKVA